MNKRKLQNEELDAAGARLLKAARLSGSEIEAIVSAPELLSSIRATIASTPLKTTVARNPVFVWKPIMAVGAVALFFFGYLSVSNKPDIDSVATVVVEPQPSTQITQDPVATPIEREFTATASKADFRPPVVAKAAPVSRKRQSRHEPRPTPPKSEGEFFALSNAGNIEDTMSRGGKIVRVDMPRSSLYALGVDLPLENGSTYIKTDLIVGADGVPRAIRFIE